MRIASRSPNTVRMSVRNQCPSSLPAPKKRDKSDSRDTAPSGPFATGSISYRKHGFPYVCASVGDPLWHDREFVSHPLEDGC